MGRGRQKAKQTKVARRLKYGGPEPDLEALERELSGKGRDLEPDPYAKYAESAYADKWPEYQDDGLRGRYADFTEDSKGGSDGGHAADSGA